MFWRGSFRDGTVSHLPFCPKTDVCLCWFHVFEFLFAVFAFLHLTQAQNEAFRDGFVMNEDAVLNEGTGCAGRMRSDRLWFRSMIQSHDTDETLERIHILISIISRDIRPSMVTHTRNLCYANNPSKCTHTAVNTHTHTVNTHTRSSGQPFMLWRPGSNWGFGALLKSTSVVVLRVERELYIHSSPTIPAGPETRTHNLCITSPTL